MQFWKISLNGIEHEKCKNLSKVLSELKSKTVSRANERYESYVGIAYSNSNANINRNFMSQANQANQTIEAEGTNSGLAPE
jgi:hypothetical protein